MTKAGDFEAKLLEFELASDALSARGMSIGCVERFHAAKQAVLDAYAGVVRELEYHSSQQCACTHLLASHRGHCTVVGMPESDHCAQCDCRHFDPSQQLQSQLAGVVAELERTRRMFNSTAEQLAAAKADNERLRAELEGSKDREAM